MKLLKTLLLQVMIVRSILGPFSVYSYSKQQFLFGTDVSR